MLDVIDKTSSPQLHQVKDKIIEYKLIETHHFHFKEFHIIELFQDKKLLMPYVDKQGRIMKYQQNCNGKKYKWGQLCDGHSIDVHLGVQAKKVYLFEGNYKGYGRRSTLDLVDGTIKHEHGIFDSYAGKLIKKIDLNFAEPVNLEWSIIAK